MPKGDSDNIIAKTRTITLTESQIKDRSRSAGTVLPQVNIFSINEVRGFINQAIQSQNMPDLIRAQQIAQYNELRVNRNLESARNLLNNERSKPRPRPQEIKRLENQVNRFQEGVRRLSAETRRINAEIRRRR